MTYRFYKYHDFIIKSFKLGYRVASPDVIINPDGEIIMLRLVRGVWKVPIVIQGRSLSIPLWWYNNTWSEYVKSSGL